MNLNLTFAHDRATASLSAEVLAFHNGDDLVRRRRDRKPPTEAAYLVLTVLISVISQIGHSNVSSSRSGLPEGSIRVSHVFAPQREQGGNEDTGA